MFHGAHLLKLWRIRFRSCSPLFSSPMLSLWMTVAFSARSASWSCPTLQLTRLMFSADQWQLPNLYRFSLSQHHLRRAQITIWKTNICCTLSFILSICVQVYYKTFDNKLVFYNDFNLGGRPWGWVGPPALQCRALEEAVGRISRHPFPPQLSHPWHRQPGEDHYQPGHCRAGC